MSVRLSVSVCYKHELLQTISIINHCVLGSGAVLPHWNCLPVCLSVCMPICLYVCLYVCLCLCIETSCYKQSRSSITVCSALALPASLKLPVCLSVCLYAYMSVHVSLCLSVSVYRDELLQTISIINHCVLGSGAVCLTETACLSVCLSVCLYVCTCVCMSVCVCL